MDHPLAKAFRGLRRLSGRQIRIIYNPGTLALILGQALDMRCHACYRKLLPAIEQESLQSFFTECAIEFQGEHHRD